jgi:hypothetical protein
MLQGSIDGAGGVAGSGHMGEEVGAVPDAVTERTMEGRPVVEGVHLVDAQVVDVAGVGFDGVEHGDWLAVGQRHDDIGVRAEVIEHGLSRRRRGVTHRAYGTRSVGAFGAVVSGSVGFGPPQVKSRVQLARRTARWNMRASYFTSTAAEALQGG